MAKQMYLLLAISLLVLPSLVNPNNLTFDFGLIEKTWYVQEIIVNGNVDPQMSGGSNEMTFNKDGSYEEVDNNRKKTSKGSWKKVSDNTIEITNGNYTTTYLVHNLTATNLHLEMLGDDKFKFEIKLGSEK